MAVGSAESNELLDKLEESYNKALLEVRYALYDVQVLENQIKSKSERERKKKGRRSRVFLNQMNDLAYRLAVLKKEHNKKKRVASDIQSKKRTIQRGLIKIDTDNVVCKPDVKVYPSLCHHRHSDGSQGSPIAGRGYCSAKGDYDDVCSY